MNNLKRVNTTVGELITALSEETDRSKKAKERQHCRRLYFQ